MSYQNLDSFRDPEVAKTLSGLIAESCQSPMRIMEVCGTHTVSIFRNGIRDMLPQDITLVSGPGCPVCVTDQKEIDDFIQLARKKNVILATFGDLMRVPGTQSSLQKQRAQGRKVKVVYSAFDALTLAAQNPKKKIVFCGVGFETTAPTVGACILEAHRQGLKNFFVYSAHKTVPPALDALMSMDTVIDGFMMPGHVSVIIGADAYLPLVEKFAIPCAIAGFEPNDILASILTLVQQKEAGESKLENTYSRAVSPEGNKKAREVMEQVFDKVDASWRGLGVIPGSGLSIREEFERFDASKAFELPPARSAAPKGCICGAILTGKKIPPQCPKYKIECTPTDPLGPCMVSSEGTCAAYYRYHGAITKVY
ncbi:hydrogenase expression/formation protein HypD [Desulfatibacillum alkenivorans DSM 16219]|jgi:hydrogenase expression/formation protein HypD|uniref:Hydrogenase expression/formation protein HypD n=1 Tax=Desulfatibacillum alkenivorans DSM 16219 TaxID=1121393 RepID=A0A1M6IDE3_9BACT|nr:hydrogenase formation protein HypD [Desulfatibacillum alkenivorans]SHJ32356.1 hydrogenase expression/formation protein HypD [Desulfatibacillum alkenivorans DSM 16219]